MYFQAVVGVIAHLLVLEGVWTADLDPLEKYFKSNQIPEDEVAYLSRDLKSAKPNTFLPGPNGELCILDDRDIHDPTYGHQDANGWCCCNLCKPSQYVARFCQCQAGTDIPSPTNDTECVGVKHRSGQFMDKHNNCTMPYTCATHCNSQQTKVSDCTPMSNISCKCKEGWYNPHGSSDIDTDKECRPKPRCPAGEEPQRIYGEDGSEMQCKQCTPGYHQPNNNSTDNCRKSRVCTLQESTSYSDSVCLNDPQPVQLEDMTDHPEDAIHTPTDPALAEESGSGNADPSSDKAAAVSDEPPSADNGTTVTSPGNLSTDPDPTSTPANESTILPTAVYMLITHLGSFLLGIFVCYMYINKIYKHGICCTKVGRDGGRKIKQSKAGIDPPPKAREREKTQLPLLY